MWQLLLTAAIATSTTFLYSRLTQKSHHHPSIQQQNDSQVETNEDHEQKQSIFMFSSTGSSEGSKKKKKKSGDSLSRRSGIPCRRLKYRSNGGNDDSLNKKWVKRGSFASYKDESMFNWGLGVGIMYMMSAGKAEIEKMSNAVDETSKVVQDLRAQIHKRKFGNAVWSSKTVINGELVGNCDVKIDDVDCPSSVLTDEHESGDMEMDQLVAELESEFLKLPRYDDEDCRNEDVRSDVPKDKVLFERIREEQDEEVSVSYQSQGVAPSELDKKLCHLLIERQENQIIELESELNSTQSKLDEKETELQALKDCVRRLAEFSISTVSDDEINVKEDQEVTDNKWDNSRKTESDSGKSVVGMKRPMSSK